MKNNNEVLVNAYYIGLIFAYFIFAFQLSVDLVGISFFVNAIQLILFLAYISKRNVSLALMYLIFTFIFLTLLPWLHYTNAIVIWRSSPIQVETFLQINTLIFLSNIIVVFFYLKNAPRRGVPTDVTHTKSHGVVFCTMLVTISVCGFLTIFALNDFSVQSLLFRGLINESRINVIDNTAVSLLVTMIARFVPFFCFLYACTEIRGKKIFKIILFVSLFLTVFPTGVARHLVGFVYLPLVLLFFPAIRNGQRFTLLLVASIIIIFPFLDQFREFDGFMNITLTPPLDYFYAAHFDAYENLATAIETSFVTYGYQLLGVLLFYIPRIYWEDKPIGSGQTMADNLGYTFNNISMPFIGEGYINFGYFGLFAFVIFFGYFSSKLDNHFEFEFKSKRVVNYPMAFYLYLIGACFFLMRGDLLSSFAFIMAGLFVSSVLKRIIDLSNGSRLFK